MTIPEAEENFAKLKNAIKKARIETATENHKTLKKLFVKRTTVNTGKINKLDINRVPITSIPKTMITPVATARSNL